MLASDLRKYVVFLQLVGNLLVIGQISRAFADTEPPVFQAEIIAQFDAFDARQGVAVDSDYFYAVNNVRITRHAKQSGEALLQWDGGADTDGPLLHLDSAVVVNGHLYAAHSNYPMWPMTSSIEIWDAETLEHLGNHNYGTTVPGSMTWIDRFNGSWWGAFANYDIVQDGMTQPYGETRNTRVVQIDDNFAITRSWALPPEILSRMQPMSNSGGSWGPDGLLYLTGHDYPEIYVMKIPQAGSELEWVATVAVPGLNGQGIAWDRSGDERDLWAILRRENRVLRIRMPELADKLTPATTNYLRQPGDFTR